MKWLKNFIKATKSNKKLLSEHNEGMSHIKEYSDGSCIITTNKKPGSIDGVHYTDYVEKVKQLKREKKHNEAVKLLLQLVGATENESKFAGKGWGVAPWYYEQLAIIYRKEKCYQKEIDILTRYHKQTKALGVKPGKLAERLKKANDLLNPKS